MKNLSIYLSIIVCGLVGTVVILIKILIPFAFADTTLETLFLSIGLVMASFVGVVVIIIKTLIPIAAIIAVLAFIYIVKVGGGI